MLEDAAAIRKVVIACGYVFILWQAVGPDQGASLDGEWVPASL